MRLVVALLASFAVVPAGELHQAARVCDADRIRQLPARNPRLNDADENGMTPLHIAIDSRQTECVWLLLKAGADGKVGDRKGRTAWHAAAQIGDARDRAIAVDEK